MIHFRPRYSLLAFLLFTAAVTVGVKLWRGPHRVVMSDPPTAEEQAVLDNNIIFSVIPPNHSNVYEYDYIRTWKGRQWLTVKVHADPSQPKYRLVHSTANRYFWEPAARDPQMPNDSQSPETIQCWLFDMRSIKQPEIQLGGIPIWGMDTIYGAYYFLSNQKRLYTYNLDVPRFVTRADLDHIEDPVFRTRVAEELASIPDPQ